MLTDAQKAFLDELEEPKETAEWLWQKVLEDQPYVVIKNGRQMTFRGRDTLNQMIGYLLGKTL